MKLKNGKNTAIKILLIVFLLLLCLDWITTSINGPLVEYLEMNYLFKYIGVAGVIVLNLGLIFILYYAYKLLGPVGRFTIILILCTICIVRGIVAWNNFMIYLNPPTVAQAMTVTAAQKVSAIKRFAWSGILMYLPGAIAYHLYTIDHKITIKDE